MKTYVLIIAKNFSKKHPRAGQPTNFYQKILDQEKLHTIRNNYPLWKKRIDEVNAGEAGLSVREWSGVPYNSKQVELFELQKEEVSIQKLEESMLDFTIDNIPTKITYKTLSKNDGLSSDDFLCWFFSSSTEPMAIIHFTSFKY